jgi:hypothetical protein
MEHKNQLRWQNAEFCARIDSTESHTKHLSYGLKTLTYDAK